MSFCECSFHANNQVSDNCTCVQVLRLLGDCMSCHRYSVLAQACTSKYWYLGNNNLQLHPLSYTIGRLLELCAFFVTKAKQVALCECWRG